MGEKVDFHLLLADMDEEEEASLLFPLLLLDFLPGGGNQTTESQL